MSIPHMQLFSIDSHASMIIVLQGPINNLKEAVCSSHYSDISPLSGGTVAFNALENRPSAFQFDTNEDLQVSS